MVEWVVVADIEKTRGYIEATHVVVVVLTTMLVMVKKDDHPIL